LGGGGRNVLDEAVVPLRVAREVEDLCSLGY
jgi:hypothetical protein